MNKRVKIEASLDRNGWGVDVYINQRYFTCEGRTLDDVVRERRSLRDGMRTEFPISKDLPVGEMRAQLRENAGIWEDVSELLDNLASLWERAYSEKMEEQRE